MRKSRKKKSIVIGSHAVDFCEVRAPMHLHDLLMTKSPSQKIVSFPYAAR